MPLPIDKTLNPEPAPQPQPPAPEETPTPPAPETIPTPPPRLELDDTSDDARAALHELRDTTYHNRNLGTIGAEIIAILPTLAGDDRGQQLQRLAKFINEKSPDSAILIAREMLALHESSLLASLGDKIRRVFTKKGEESGKDYDDRVESIVAETKKPFFELLATGRLSAKDLERFVCGGIRFAQVPPPAIGHAVASISAGGGMPQLTFYEDFFDSQKNRGREHIVKHELGHVIAAQIFSGDMEKLEQIAADPNTSAEGLPPHLTMVVAMIRHPEEAARREHRGEGSHLHRELMKLHSAQAGGEDDVANRRKLLVREILAERVANYFESSGALDSYAALRFGGVGAEFDDNDPHFTSEKVMFEAISEGMKEKDNWRFGEYAPDIFWDDICDDIAYEPETLLYSTPTEPAAPEASPGPRPKSTLEKFFAWLTGQKK